MFELDEAIAGWKLDLERQNFCSDPDLDELESHLLEEIERLRSLRLSEEESFWLAARRLGSAGAIRSEFAKVNGGVIWRHRIFWMATGILSFTLIDFLLKFASEIFTWAGSSYGLPNEALAVVGVASRFILLFPALLAIYLLCRAKDAASPGIVQRWFSANKPAFIVAVMVLAFGCYFLRIYAYSQMATAIGPREMMQVIALQSRWNSAWAISLPILLAILIFWLSLVGESGSEERA